MGNANARIARLEEREPGKFSIASDLTFDTVTALLEESQEPFSKHEQLTVDMSGVEKADSAGHALLLEWKSWAANAGKTLEFQNIPAQILAIARMSGTEALLGERQ